ncbi:MAG: hypothetical protein ACE5D3_06750, partial [Candidatus Binatia bacterium]
GLLPQAIEAVLLALGRRDDADAEAAGDAGIEGGPDGVAVAVEGELVEHHVRSITLLKNDVELVRAYLHPVQASPKVTFTVALEETATLRVLEEPTHSAAWESSVEVVVSQ